MPSGPNLSINFISKNFHKNSPKFFDCLTIKELLIYSEDELYNKYMGFINSSVHLIRNMIDHGIESVEKRLERKKPKKGNIKIHFSIEKKGIKIVFSDDGQGVNSEVIKKKVLEKGMKTEEELSTLKGEDYFDFLFLPGFSTKDQASDISGRGVGLEAVKFEVEKLKGTISLSSKDKKGTTFTVELPLLS